MTQHSCSYVCTQKNWKQVLIYTQMLTALLFTGAKRLKATQMSINLFFLMWYSHTAECYSEPTPVFLPRESLRGAWWATVPRVTKSQIQLKGLSTQPAKRNDILIPATVWLHLESKSERSQPQKDVRMIPFIWNVKISHCIETARVSQSQGRIKWGVTRLSRGFVFWVVKSFWN